MTTKSRSAGHEREATSFYFGGKIRNQQLMHFGHS
jgi:hypothetical protein